MMWAENQGHNIANAILAASKLEAAANVITRKDLPYGDAVSAMKVELQKMGFEVFGN
ncbi:hypothetical protein [Pseudomonas sp. RIT-PI-S]|uniref:hypothetical protein n=1 Tax=Pseudomonas sp. RIT-PI-S TaxID=3035295 RepID=UPI0021DA6FDD|nr:hypothetical protein [Pseudomonas sp. RIT-PI-S]